MPPQGSNQTYRPGLLPHHTAHAAQLVTLGAGVVPCVLLVLLAPRWLLLHLCVMVLLVRAAPAARQHPLRCGLSLLLLPGPQSSPARKDSTQHMQQGRVPCSSIQQYRGAGKDANRT